jgi:hypothetical protein
MKKTPETKRSTGFTKITLTLPNDLLAVLDDAAALDNRTRSNLIAYSLHRLKEANPFLGEPRPPRDKSQAQKVAGPPGPCPCGHIRPCERKQPPIPKPSPN